MYKRKGRSNLREEKEGEITEKKNLDESKFHFNSIRRIDEKVEKVMFVFSSFSELSDEPRSRSNDGTQDSVDAEVHSCNRASSHRGALSRQTKPPRG